MKKVFLFSLFVMLLASCNGPSEKAVEQRSAKDTKSIVVPTFNADSAYYFVEKQVLFGPRVPGTEAHLAAAAWFTEQLSLLGLPGELLGPAPASLYRIKGFYRIQTILRGDNLVPYAPRIRKIMQEYHSRKPVWPVRLAVDFNPQVVL